MTPPIPTTEPIQIVAGDTAKWTRAFADYPATDGWVLTYAFRGVGSFDVTAQPSAAGFLVTAASDVTSQPEGLYDWVAQVSLNGERYTVDSGKLVLAPDLTNISDGSLQPFAEQMVAGLKAQLLTLTTTPIESYTIEAQTTMRRKIAEVNSLLNQWTAKLNRKRNRGRPRSYSAVMGVPRVPTPPGFRCDR